LNISSQKLKRLPLRELNKILPKDQVDRNSLINTTNVKNEEETNILNVEPE